MKRFLSCFIIFCSAVLYAQNRIVSSLDFEGAAALAVLSSKELKATKAGRAIREGAWKLGLRAYLPQLSLSVSEDDRLSLVSSDSFLKNYTVSLEQLLWDGGRTGSSRALERAELVLLGDELEREEAGIAEAALEMYRGLLLERKIISIKESALDSLREQGRILGEELALGMIRPVELAEGEITIKEAELELVSLKLTAIQDERSFSELLGLEELPLLGEGLDILRIAILPDPETAQRTAITRNPELERSRHTLGQKQAEAKYASLSWLPTIKAAASFTVSGQHYPLSRYSWSMGLTVNFSSPWFSAGSSGNAGWEAPYDRNARVQQTIGVLPDPASAAGSKQAELALALEKEKYADSVKSTGRNALLAVEKAGLAESRRKAAVEVLGLAGEKFALNTVLLDLGRITRVELMAARIDYAEKECLAAEAALAVLAAERELEKMFDIKPGTLSEFCKRYGGKP
jgi:outer membrane protein TolC